MTEIRDSQPSGDPEEPSWPNGSWTPPPPPPGWHHPGWQQPTWHDPRYEQGWGGTPAGGPAGHPGQAGQPGGGWPYWGAPPGWGAPGQGAQGWGYGWAPPRPRRHLPSTVTALLLVVAVLVGLGIGHGVWRSVHNSIGASGNGSTGNGFGVNPFGGNSVPFGNGNAGGNGSPGSSGSSGSGAGSLSGAAAVVANELVDIDTTLSYQNDEAAGTGIVLSSDGYVLTNNHVISGATSIKATDIGNGQTFIADVVGYDRTHDVAVLKLQGASGLRAASLGDSSKVTVGEPIIGLGNAGGVGGAPSTAPGQITALDQSITAQDESNGTSEKLTGLIQTDANIQPGDSGGALIDSAGKVVGMDTAASTGFSFQTQGNQGFAIPIDQASAIADQIRASKGSSTIHIGPTAFLGVEVDTSGAGAGTQGALIRNAVPGTPAAQVGIGNGDIITSLGGSPVNSAADLTNLIGRYQPGDKVPVTWTAPGGSSHTATITLAKGPAA